MLVQILQLSHRIDFKDFKSGRTPFSNFYSCKQGVVLTFFTSKESCHCLCDSVWWMLLCCTFKAERMSRSTQRSWSVHEIYLGFVQPKILLKLCLAKWTGQPTQSFCIKDLSYPWILLYVWIVYLELEQGEEHCQLYLASRTWILCMISLLALSFASCVSEYLTDISLSHYASAWTAQVLFCFIM